MTRFHDILSTLIAALILSAILSILTISASNRFPMYREEIYFVALIYYLMVVYVYSCQREIKSG